MRYGLLYWSGCTTSYLAPELSGNVVKLLGKLGVEFRALGSREKCCGYPLLLLGDGGTFSELAADVSEVIKSEEPEAVLTNCPGCYRCFVNYYPKLSGIKVMHTTHLIYDAVKNGKLKFRGGEKLRVTYHDPCDLGRHSGVYDLPRNILTSIPNVELVEMSRSRENSRCCGAGGVLRLSIPQLSTQIAVTKIKDDVSPLNVDAVITACPTCIKNLKDGSSISEMLYGTKGLAIYDIVELINMLTE
ncbi:MAG: (Fe-S)-binding protein [Sulfolobales archaeon]|nr:(Fe-S)-binding protein [Sulfolobales archaeon]